MEIIRPVKPQDLDDLVELASFLDTVNFPNDRDKLEEDVLLSQDSFSGNVSPTEKAMYQFALEDRERKKVIGVSKIIAHHGTPGKPHYYWQITYDRRESQTIGIGLTHQVLTLGKDTQGHSEIAGIIVHPGYQGKKLGKQLFYVRFLFIALNRQKFMDTIVSELLPPLTEDEKSVLWEAYGRKFTGLTYQEADQLSHDNKEFIEALFPQHKIYTCLLPLKARQVLGRVGKNSMPVKYLAEKNGFQFLEQIDPFDGGPHYGCKTGDVLAIKNVETGKGMIMKNDRGKNLHLGLAGNLNTQTGDFLGVQVKLGKSKDYNNQAIFHCPPWIFKALHCSEGDLLHFLAYP